MPYAQEDILPYDRNRPKTEQMEQMFDSIAPSYDRFTHGFSFGIDKMWRKTTIDSLKPYAPQLILDIATGTGDFAMLAYKRLAPKKIIAADLSEGMMAVGKEKVKKAHLEDIIEFHKEDCAKLSQDDNTFDAVTVAYGVRNFQNLDKGLQEIRRVLKPGGHAVILELSTPHRAPMKQLFWLYSHVVMSWIGRIILRDAKAVDYLPASMQAFPQGEIMKEILINAGFKDVRFKRFTFGLSTMYLAQK